MVMERCSGCGGPILPGHRYLAASPQATWRGKAAAQPRSWFGMNVAYLGIAVFLVGVTIVTDSASSESAAAAANFTSEGSSSCWR